MRFFLLVAALSILTPILLVGASLQQYPIVLSHIPATAEDAQRAKRVASTFYSLTESQDGGGKIALTSYDLNSLAKFAQRAVSRVRVEARMSDGIASMMASLELAFGLWINTSIDVLNSKNGVRVNKFSIGSYSIDGSVFAGLFELIANGILGDQAMTKALEAIQSIKISDRYLIADISMSRSDRLHLTQRMRTKAREAVSVSSVDTVARYFAAVSQAQSIGHLSRDGSLSQYIQYLFNMASRQAELFSDEQAKEEIKAAILALAIHCGDINVQQFVGTVVNDTSREVIKACDGVTLGGRADLRKHFMISAALAVVSNSSIALTVGELKELLDADTGGSGFSFDDIAADMAGIKFANLSIASPSSEWSRIAAISSSEQSVFPQVHDLPSGMSEGEFLLRFGSSDSPRYDDMIASIDARISNLAVFQAAYD